MLNWWNKIFSKLFQTHFLLLLPYNIIFIKTFSRIICVNLDTNRMCHALGLQNLLRSAESVQGWSPVIAKQSFPPLSARPSSWGSFWIGGSWGDSGEQSEHSCFFPIFPDPAHESISTWIMRFSAQVFYCTRQALIWKPNQCCIPGYKQAKCAFWFSFPELL